MTKPRNVPAMYYHNLAASIHQPHAYRRRLVWRDVLTLAIVVIVIVAACWLVATAGDARLN